MLLDHFLNNSAERFPEKNALLHGKKCISYKDLHKRCVLFSNALKERNVRRSDRIVIFLDNSIETVIALYGILKADAIFVIVNPATKSRKLNHVLTDSQAPILITDSDGVKTLTEIAPHCPDLRSVIVTDYSLDIHIINHVEHHKIPGSPISIESFEQVLKSATASESDRKVIDIDLASLMYTSGSTTGNPKGVMLTHSNMVTAVRSITQYLENRHDDIILNYLPLSFDYGLYQVLMSIAFGGTVLLEKAFVYPYQAIKEIRENKITGFPLVPAMAALLLQLNNILPDDIQSIRYITNTGQALPPAHIKKLLEVFPQSKLFSMYGLTECKRALFLPPSQITIRPGSVGKAIPNTEVWLVNDQGQKIEEPDIAGELVIRGGHVMKGYWNSPDATDEVLKPGSITGEKVLMSGDLFRMDSEGYLYFISRKDDLIKCGGERISPKEIEDILHELPQIAEAAVIGVPDPILGFAVKAYIVRKADCQIDEHIILRHCSQHLEHSRIPKIIEFIDTLPKSINGKVQKKALYQA